MTMPHKEDWSSAEDFEITVLGPELDRGIDGPREVLARAAPNMAVALLAVLEWNKRSRELPEWPAKSPMETVRAALAKAGVPLDT